MLALLTACALQAFLVFSQHPAELYRSSKPIERAVAKQDLLIRELNKEFLFLWKLSRDNVSPNDLGYK